MNRNSFLETYFKLKEANNGIISLPKNEKIFNTLNLEDYFPIKHFQDGSFAKRIIDKNNEAFYIKPCSRLEFEDEILFSRLYQKAGLCSATYYPLKCKDNDQKYVFSDNVITKNCILAGDFPSSKLHFSKSAFYKPRSLFKPTPKDYTESGIKDLIKMQAMDVASFNPDRHENNYAFKLDENDKVEEIRLFDYGASNFYYNKKFLNMEYYDKISSSSTSLGKTILKDLKDNELIANFVKPVELAKMIDDIDVKEQSYEIEEEFKFKFDKDFVNLVVNTYNETAQILGE